MSSDTPSIYTSKERAAHKVLLRARLAGVTKPRRLTAHFFWAQENKEIIKTLKEEDGEGEEEDRQKKLNQRGKQKGKQANNGSGDEDDSDEDSGKKKNSNGLAKYQALCKSEFEKLDEETQREWKEMANVDLTAKSELYTAITKADRNTLTPQFRQQ